MATKRSVLPCPRPLAGLLLGGCLALSLAPSAGAAPPKKADHGEMPPPQVIPGQKVSLALLDLGRKRFEQGDLPGALDAFTKARAEAPKDPRPLYLRGTVYQKQRKLPEAEADFRKALELDPKLVDVRAELGAILTDTGRAAEALEQLEQAVAQKADHFEAQFNLGVARETLGRWPEAAAAYRKAAQLKPQDADVRLNLAAALRRSGKVDEALVAAREAAQLAPDDAQAHLNLGLLLGEAKRADEAVAELTAATRLAPDSQKAWWRLGVVQYRRGEVDQALVALGRARALKATPEVLTDLGLAQRKKGDLPAAEGSFRSALAMNGRYQVARIHLASTLAHTGRCKDAEKELQLVPAVQEYSESVNRVRADCQMQAGKKK